MDMVPPKKPTEKKSFSQFLTTSWRALKIITANNKALSFGLCFVLFFSSLLSFLASWIFGQAINAITAIGSTHPTSWGAFMEFLNRNPYFILLIAGWIIVPIIREFVGRIESHIRELFQVAVDNFLDIIVVRQRASLDVASFEDKDRQDLILKASRNMGRLMNFSNRTISVFDGLFNFLLASLALGYFYWWIIPVVVIGVIPELITRFFFGKGAYVIWSRHTTASRMYNQLASYFGLSNRIAEMRIFQTVEFFANKALAIVSAIRAETLVHLRKSFRYGATAGFLGDVVRASVIVFFISEAVRGNMSIGSLVFLVGAVNNLQGSVRSISSSLGSQYEDLLHVRDVLAFLDLKPLIKKPEHPVLLAPKTTHSIEFKNVSFAHPGQKENALTNVSLKIEPGQRVGIVGINGAGKTTITRLICGFYHPTKGTVLIGGIDLATIDPDSWYANLGVLFQEFGNYNLVLRDVIASGDTTRPASDMHIERALKKANADFIGDWEEGLDTHLGNEYGGKEPSGGQKQKLAIARLLYRIQLKAQVLILDEPTAALDAESEAAIFESLEKLPKEKTVILISHRFSTLRNADKIFVFDGGKVIEEGSHEELISSGGKYAQLFKAQAAGYQ